jgi:hypothetical protein
MHTGSNDLPLPEGIPDVDVNDPTYWTLPSTIQMLRENISTHPSWIFEPQPYDRTHLWGLSPGHTNMAIANTILDCRYTQWRNGDISFVEFWRKCNRLLVDDPRVRHQDRNYGYRLIRFMRSTRCPGFTGSLKAASREYTRRYDNATARNAYLSGQISRGDYCCDRLLRIYADRVF